MPKPKKYEQICDAIVARIQKQRLAPGDRIGTEFELCDIFHVARGTVRQAIQQLIKEGVLYTGQGSGTYVKRTIRADHLSAISLVLEEEISLHIPFYASLVEGVLRSAHARGFAIEYCPVGKRRETAPRIREAAVVLLPKRTEIVEQIYRAHIPFVVVDPQVDFPVPATVVRPDDMRCGELAAEQLIRRGHKCLGMLAGDPTDYSGRMRLEGVRQALRKNGLSPAELVVEECEFSYKGGVDGVSKLFSRPEPRFTGLVCANDQVALGAMNTVQENGVRVPEELSVVGIDGTISGKFSRPHLSSVDCRNSEKTKLAVDLLIARMDDPSLPAVEELVEPVVISRQSVARVE